MSETLDAIRSMCSARESFEIAVFENAVAAVAQEGPDSILPLSTLFDDSFPYHEAMFAIVHAIESFDDKVYVHELLKATPSLCARAPKWASIVFMRVLNSDATRSELVIQLIEASPEVKIAIRSLMERINERSVEFLAKTTPVIIAAR